MVRLIVSCFVLLASSVRADVVVATQTIRAKQIITFEHVVVKNAELAGTFSNLDDVVGLEARVAIYAGRPIRTGDIGPPAIVDRNDIVTLAYQHGSLVIRTEGRALGRGAVGDLVRVLNLSSHKTLSGLIKADGTIEVK